MGVDVTAEKLRALGGREVLAPLRGGRKQHHCWVLERDGELVYLDLNAPDALRIAKDLLK